MKNIISKRIHEPQSVYVKVSWVLIWKIDGQKNIFIADDMGFENKIPLWMFGLLY